jgi:transposase
MRSDSLLSAEQREAAVALFEQQWSYRSTARRLAVPVNPVLRLYHRWCACGRDALVTSETRRQFAFEFKLEVVQRFLAGESKLDLTREFSLSSPKLVQTWVRRYHEDGDDGLRSKRRGRPPGSPPPVEGDELAQLRRENERLRAEVAYLGKLRALRVQDRRR